MSNQYTASTQDIMSRTLALFVAETLRRFAKVYEAALATDDMMRDTLDLWSRCYDQASGEILGGDNE